MRFGIEGSGLSRVWGLGCRVQVWGLEFRHTSCVSGRAEIARSSISKFNYPKTHGLYVHFRRRMVQMDPTTPMKAPIPKPANRDTSLIRNCFLLGPYSRPMPRALWWS